jgi:hypothetical protein
MFAGALARKDQRGKGVLYPRGLLLDGQRKSMRPHWWGGGFEWSRHQKLTRPRSVVLSSGHKILEGTHVNIRDARDNPVGGADRSGSRESGRGQRATGRIGRRIGSTQFVHEMGCPSCLGKCL